MTATYVRIDTIVKAGDGGLGQNGTCKDFLDFHYPHYNGGAKKLKGLPARVTVQVPMIMTNSLCGPG